MNMKRFVLSALALMLLIGGFLAFQYYRWIFQPNVELENSTQEFFIASDDDYDAVRQALSSFLEDEDSFDWVAERKGYPDLVKPGRYILLDGMSNNALVNLLRSGNQEPVNVVVPSVRTRTELAARVAKGLEFDSASFVALLNDEGFCRQYGFNTTTIFTLFIPNTYEFYWNTTAEEFVERMAREYKRFWTDERKEKAGAIGLSQSEVSILASLVQSEQGAHPDERPVVAGLYLNRLRKRMRLESDPTLIHALGDFSIKRVLNVHKKVKSPYNTYLNAGLPPGPILLPEVSSLDAVLEADKHNYLYMCAKEDFSGYHNFASNYRQHINNAKRYQRELNRRKIYR